MTKFTIGIVGHRYIDAEPTEAFVRQACHDILAGARRRQQHLQALSALAAGADTIFAQTALSLHIPLHVIRPFDEYAGDFSTEEALHTYDRLKAEAASERRLPFVTRSVEAYYAAMREVVDRSDLLLAVWDGQEGKGKGGTSDAITRVREMQRDWIHLDVRDATRYSHCKKDIYAGTV
jgi:hypothetical protein